MSFDPDQLNQLTKSIKDNAISIRNLGYAHIYAAVYTQTASKVTARKMVEHFRHTVETK